MGKLAPDREPREPEVEDDADGFEDEIDENDPADDSHESREAHGRVQPQPSASPAPAGSLLNAAPPPAPAASRGGPPASGDGRPEDAIPALIEKEYGDKGQHKTGITYGGDMRKFLNWLTAKSLSFGQMPPGSAQQFLTEVYRNALIRNRAITALTLMFERAQTLGIQFLPQAMERTKTGRAAKSAAVDQGPPAPAQLNGMPGGMPLSTTAMPAVTGGPAIPMQLPAPPKPPPPPKPTSVFPSLGQRVQISLIANGYQQGIPPGTKIPINTYQKEQIEAAGSIENFLMLYMRPTYGPFAGEPPTTYYFQQLDTAGRPLPGADWTNTIMPGDTARPAPGHSAPMAAATPTSMFQFPSVAPGAPAAVQGDLIARMLEREFARADREHAEAKAQREALETKRNKGDITDAMFFMLSQQIPQPRPVDPAEVARRVREELDRMQPPATTVSPPAGASLFDAVPKEDPAMMRVMAMLERLLEKQSQPPPPAPPQKDPVMAFGEMLALFERARPPPDPLQAQLAALALKSITEPPKPKTLVDLVQEMKLLKEAGNIMGGESGPPSLVEGIVDIVHAVTENAAALGEAIGRIRSGAVSGAFEAAKKKREQAAAPPQPAQPQAQPRPLPSRETQERLVAMCNGIQNGDEDQKIVENLLGVIQQLDKDPDPTGMDRWRRFSGQIVQRYLMIEAPQEVQGLVFWFFEQLGAKKLYSTYPKVVERLCQALTDNYSVIHALLTNGKEKVLPGVPQAAVTGPTVNATAVQAPPVAAAPAENTAPTPEPEPTEDEGDEEEDEEDDGDDDEEEPEQQQQAAG